MAGGEFYAFDCGYKRTMMIKKQAGFTLVELMVTMVIFVLVIAAASSMFTGILNQFKQQSKIAETNIEGLAGLQMLRTDIEQAGYGLPYGLGGVSYSEAVNDAITAHNDTTYNDSTANPPRAFVMGSNSGVKLASVGTTNGSDVLVVKATNVATNEAAHKWAYISNIGANNTPPRSWTNATTGTAVADENLEDDDRVIVLRPVVGSNQQVLVNSGGSFTAQFNDSLASFSDSFEPVANTFETYIIYGVTPTADPVTTPLRMPFNRADYYIRRPSTNMPARCAPNTGIL
jgi:prepilin-type N-terminal cleavage/methylation domain-containing protein